MLEDVGELARAGLCSGEDGGLPFPAGLDLTLAVGCVPCVAAQYKQGAAGAPSLQGRGLRGDTVPGKYRL